MPSRFHTPATICTFKRRIMRVYGNAMLIILALRVGMFPSSLWTIGGSVRPQTSVAYWILDFGGVRYRMCQRHSRESARYPARATRGRLCGYNPRLCEDFSLSSVHALTFGGLLPARNSSQGIPAWTLTFYRVRHVLCWCPDRSNLFYCPWWCPYTSNQGHLADTYIFVLGDRSCLHDFGILCYRKRRAVDGGR